MLFYLLSVLGLVPTFQKTKCKRLLNLTLERIKLLEKRRQARVRQLHRDVIELLQLKKERKVDPLLLRIWKELCLFSVYIKIAEYSEFVQINLKHIAGQRECPSGLEEPLAGLCFAASCCADLPELQELREIFAMKYGKQIVSSGQDLTPNCHVNQQFLDYLYAKDPLETRKQALLEEITAKYNLMQGHEQDTQQQDIHDSLSIEGFVDANERNQLQEGIDYTITESEVKDRSESEELPDVNVVQKPNHIEPVCEEDLGSTKLANELANRKRTLEDRKTCCSVFKRAYSRRNFGRNNSDTGRRLASVHHDGYEEGIPAHMNKDVAPNDDLSIIHYVEQPPCSHPPQRTPPRPPPKRPPPPPPSLRVISMPSSHNDNANTSLPVHCSTMANNYYHGSHVHPRLPKYEDLYATFTALKH